MKKPLVSVVLAAYNGERYLLTQIESILSQTWHDLELIIVDDASKDRTKEIARIYREKDRRVKLFENGNNLGITANFLKGLSLANGKYFAFSDQDDVWRPDKLAVLVTLLQSDLEAQMAYSDLEVCDENLKRIHSSFFHATRTGTKKGDLSRLALIKNLMPGCSMLFTRQVKERVTALSSNPDFMSANQAEVLDETPFMHDYLVFVVAALLGHIAYSSEKLARYRQHSTNRIGAFYESRSGRTQFASLLEKKIGIIARFASDLNPASVEHARRFSQSLSKGSFFGDASLLPEYLFLRSDTPEDFFLGFVECIWPGFYRLLRSGIRRSP